MTRGRKGEDIHWRFARPSFHPLPCPEPTLATCAPRPSGARSAGRHHVRRDQPVVANLAAPANAKFYPVTVYGVRNLQCATRCNSPGPWACHHRQYLHQTSHTITRPQAGHTSRSRSKATSLTVAAHQSRPRGQCFGTKGTEVQAGLAAVSPTALPCACRGAWTMLNPILIRVAR